MAIAAAVALTRRALMPTSPTVSGSSAVARIARPSGVRDRNNWRPPSTTIAVAKINAERVADVDVVGQRPGIVGERSDKGRERARVGAELLEQQVVDDDRQAERAEDRHQKTGARAALQHGALQRPADRRHRRHERSSSPRKGEISKRSASTNSAKAARTARLPCAMLMMPITLNMNDSPQAISA